MATSMNNDEQVKMEIGKKHVETVLGWLRDVNTKGVCIFGTQNGMGKTWIARNVMERARKDYLFDISIWITISVDDNSDKVLKKIAERLSIPTGSNETKDILERKISSLLSERKVLLVLDDKGTLEQSGVPQPDHKGISKIIITTSSETFFQNMMNAQNYKTLKREPLSEEESWKLFCAARSVVNQRDKHIVKDCEGIPWAIILRGKASRGIENLDAGAPSTPNYDAIQKALKFGYDRLKDPAESCFLYCTLFPEDCDIHEDELIRYWIMEGFINGSNDFKKANAEGHRILEDLIDRHMLHREDKIIREKALDSRRRCRGIMAKNPSGSVPTTETNMWEGFERISLMDKMIRTLPLSPSCPKLLTLLLRGNLNLREIPMPFFEDMPHLQVLDLSHTGVESLPPSLSHLTKLRMLLLRGCSSLQDVRHIRGLEKLEVLNLSGTKIKDFPYEILKQTRLRRLDLQDTKNIQEVEWKKITSLPDELIWDQGGSCHCAADPLGEVGKICISVSNSKIFQSLDKISPLWEEKKNNKKFSQRFCFGVYASDEMVKDDYDYSWRKKFRFSDIYHGIQHFPGSNYSDGCLEIQGFRKFPVGIEGILIKAQFVSLKNCQFLKQVIDLGIDCMMTMKECWMEKCDNMDSVVGTKLGCNTSLEYLWVSNMKMLRTVCEVRTFAQLKHLYVDCCPKLIIVFSLPIILGNLEKLEIKFCDSLELVFGDGKLEEDFLPELKELLLWELPQLTTVCVGRLPKLERFTVRECPKLQELPQIATDVEIRGEEEWCKKLELAEKYENVKQWNSFEMVYK